MHSDKIRNKLIDELFEAILSLNNIDECYMFFEDLCTVNELQSLSQRLEVAKMLQSGLTYNEIAEMSKASTATISRINKCLIYGEDGYKLVLDKLNKK